MKRFRVTIGLKGQPDINVMIEAHTVDEARRIARAQYPHGRVLNIVPA